MYVPVDGALIPKGNFEVKTVVIPCFSKFHSLTLICAFCAHECKQGIKALIQKKCFTRIVLSDINAFVCVKSTRSMRLSTLFN